MLHIIFAFVDLFFTAFLLFFSQQQFKKGNFQISVVFLLIAGFILRMYTASDLYLHEWDERYHALVANNMINNFFTPVLYKVPLLPFDYRSWSSNYIWF